MKNNRVVITGIGPICSIADNQSDLWKKAVSGKTNLNRHKCFVDKELWEEFFVHKLDNLDINKYVSNQAVIKWINDWKEGHKDIDFELMASVIAQAIKSSNLKISQDDKSVGMILVHENPGLEDLIDSVADATFESVNELSKGGQFSSKLKVKQMVYDKCVRIGYNTQSFMHLFFIAKLFNIHGFSLFINNACSSGLYAIEVAGQLIKSGRLKTVIVAGVDYPDYIYKYLWFKNLEMYASDGLIKPYSKKRNGIVFGEGGAGIVLESYESAKERGANIYAEYLSGGFNLESSKITLPDVSSDLYFQAICEALNNANLAPENIDLIVPHGIGTPITDLHEARSIEKAFSLKKDVFVTAFKPYIGHNLGSSSLLELCMLLLCMQEDYILPTLNLFDRDERIHLNLVESGVKKELNKVMKLSCAFAGYNAAAVFGRLN